MSAPENPREPPVRRALRESADRVIERVVKTLPLWGGYTTEWTVEAWLLREWAQGASGAGLAFALNRKLARGESPDCVIPWEQRPFVALEWTLSRASGDDRYLPPWLAQTRRWQASAPRTREGVVMHPTGCGRDAVLLDDLQEYASRCLRGGVWAGDGDLIEEGIGQWLKAERLLRDPDSGLWSQGQGWLENPATCSPGAWSRGHGWLENPATCSPGAWSRGHGWLLRGLVSGMIALDGRGERARLEPVLRRVLTALAAVQGPEGGWHRLLNHPPSETLVDTSGTGMILYSVFEAWRRGWVEERDAWAERLRRAAHVMSVSVDKAGGVAYSCPGPGPLLTEAVCLETGKPPARK